MTAKRRWAIVIATFVGVAVGLVLARSFLLTTVGKQLWRDDAPAAGAPVGIVLMGDNTLSRAQKALDLYKGGTIERIVLMREKEILFPGTPSAVAPADIARDFLYAAGVQIDDLSFIADCATTSTVDEARCVKNYLMASGSMPDRLVVISTWTHTARAGWIFDQILAPTKIEMIPVALEDVVPDNWWQRELGVLSVFNEYLKWTYWQLKAWSGGLTNGATP